MKNAATALQLFPMRAPATGLQPACRKVAATDGLQLRARNRPETRMDPRVAMQPRPCNRPTLLQRLRCTLHPRGEATPATVATDTPHQRRDSQTDAGSEAQAGPGGRLSAPMLAGGMGESARAHLPPRGCRANQQRANAATGYRLLQAARCTASRCDRSVTAPACKPWAAPLVRPHRCPWDARQGTHKRFSGAGRGEVAKRCRAACWPIQGCLRASAGRGRRIGASLDGQRFEARKRRA